jgi:hypothetical protein
LHAGGAECCHAKLKRTTRFHGFLHTYRDRDTRAVQELNNSSEAAELSGKEVPTAQGLAN